MTHPNPDPLYVPPDPAPLRRGIAWGLIIEVVAIAVVLGLAWLAFSPKPAASSAGDCGVVLTHVGGLYVDIHDDGDMWLSFDAIEGVVDLTIDGPNGIELGPGEYTAVWDDGTSEPFTLACIPEPTDDPPLTIAGEDPATPPPAVSAGISGTATWYCGAGSPCTVGYGPLDMVAAIDPTTGIDKGERVRVTHAGESIVVRVVDVCACEGERIIDLTSGAFLRLADTSRGVIPVEIESLGAAPPLPATDTAP